MAVQAPKTINIESKYMHQFLTSLTQPENDILTAYSHHIKMSGCVVTLFDQP